MNPIDPKALFRLSVLGPLISRERLERSELQQLLRELASREYAIPGSRRRYLSEKTIQAWYYAWRLRQLDGLTPKPRADRGQSKLPAATQAAILAAKRDNPRRSLCQIRQLLEATGTVARGRLARSTIHRLLQQHGLSRITGSASLPEEKRSFVAATAGAIWYGDVMHGPRVPIDGKLAKSYLVSLFDDASRLLTHSAFCPGETALDIEGVLKQAVLKRGIPLKLVVDNGAAYRAETLQGICARLGIHLIHCRPYAPEGKGKLERWHRRCRDQFLSELDERHIASLDDLNARLWAWLEQVYHRSPHAGLAGMTPLARYQQDLSRIRPLGPLAASLDALFQHRVTRLVRKDGTVSYQGQRFEVPFELSGKTVSLVVDPHTETVIGVEDEQGESIGAATPLDALANATRQRRQSDPADASPPQKGASGPNLIEQIYQQYYDPEGE
ncbi:DDE-type integrase/transposase/recombinase [Candidatus Accumulibacter sp. ACC003]|uniref:DDE-type integrase/transposase/recombinase n=1 Tax=Candidatus Accumulibacter sp. ACC003 TaxID=2823334 RepID=UPI0025BDB1B9|nr:DDE-type integrase/transposase/recombinase [Candidatus Accumulibacter sp. ACC003]